MLHLSQAAVCFQVSVPIKLRCRTGCPNTLLAVCRVKVVWIIMMLLAQVSSPSPFLLRHPQRMAAARMLAQPQAA